MANIEQKVETLLKPKIEELGYELYDVEYVKEGKNYFLRIYIDNEKGIDLKDCEKVNDAIMEPLGFRMWAMRNIDLVEVIKPQTLRDEMKEIIKKASKKYNVKK